MAKTRWWGFFIYFLTYSIDIGSVNSTNFLTIDWIMNTSNLRLMIFTPLHIQYLPEKWYKFHYFDTALFWSYEGQSHEVNIATQSYFQRSFWWAFKKYGICNHLRENWEPLKKWVHFPWTLRLLEPFQVDFRQKPFLIRFSTFIWPGYHEIILEFGQLYWELERNFQKLPQIFI